MVNIIFFCTNERTLIVLAGNLSKLNVRIYLSVKNVAGTPINRLDEKALGCVFPIWAIVTIALLTCFIIVVAIVLNRKWETIKFYMFVHFNVLTDDDGPEDLDEMEFDGYLTYR